MHTVCQRCLSVCAYCLPHLTTCPTTCPTTRSHHHPPPACSHTTNPHACTPSSASVACTPPARLPVCADCLLTSPPACLPPAPAAPGSTRPRWPACLPAATCLPPACRPPAQMVGTPNGPPSHHPPPRLQPLPNCQPPIAEAERLYIDSSELAYQLRDRSAGCQGASGQGSAPPLPLLPFPTYQPLTNPFRSPVPHNTTSTTQPRRQADAPDARIPRGARGAGRGGRPGGRRAGRATWVACFMFHFY
jgi:hypothetical protein